EAAGLPIDLDGRGAKTHRLIIGASEKIHVDGAVDGASGDRSGAAELETEDRLAQGGARVMGTGRAGGHGIVEAAALARIEKGVEERHSREADGELLGGLDLRLRQLV